MTPIAMPQVAMLGVVGIGLGMLLLWRGFGGYRSAARIGDTATSRVASLAAGEVRVTGVAEPAELTLVSPLQSATCIWYRAKVTRIGDDQEDTVFEEERGVGFRVRDETGSIRVFPRGAAMDVPLDFDDRTGTFGDEPPGLATRHGSAFAPGATDTAASRAAQAAALLTVRPEGTFGDGMSGGGLAALGLGTRGRYHYREARIEPGDVVTVLGVALPFGLLADPLDADTLDGAMLPMAGLADPEIAADLAEARAAGLLRSPEDAWGNAAIPGFGIGRPVVAPELDPRATTPQLATAEEAAETERVFDLTPDLLVLATTPEARLLVADGSPGQAVARQEQRFVIGLLGAVLAIGSAVVVAFAVTGGFA